MATQYTESTHAIGRDCISNIGKVESRDGTIIWYRGNVFTPDGLVEIVYSEPGHTCMRLVHNGRLYYREWRKQFQPRYLTNLARKFAKNITQEAHDAE